MSLDAIAACQGFVELDGQISCISHGILSLSDADLSLQES